MGRIELTRLDKAPAFRKIAMGTWNNGGDPTVYGLLEIDMSRAMPFMLEYGTKNGIKISPAHLVGKAIAHCMSVRPEINGMIRGGRIYLRKHVDIFYQVNIPGVGSDKAKDAVLSGAVINGAEKLSVREIAQRLVDKASRAKSAGDDEVTKSVKMFEFVPWRLAKWMLNLSSFLTYGLNLNLSFLGIPRDPFGSVMITNVGSLGIDVAWAPLVPYSRVPLLLAIGAIQDSAVVRDGKVVVAPVMRIGVTFDHRMIDGVHAAQMSREFKRYFADPETFFGV